MELKEFITQTLVQIQQGVQDAIAQQSTGANNGIINPVFSMYDSVGKEQIQKVEFDVAVTATDKSSGGGKAGIKVFSVELGGEGSKGSESSVASRVKFTIPLVPPFQVPSRSRPT